jgi:hypothetical protein
MKDQTTHRVFRTIVVTLLLIITGLLFVIAYNTSPAGVSAERSISIQRT